MISGLDSPCSVLENSVFYFLTVNTISFDQMFNMMSIIENINHPNFSAAAGEALG